VKYFILVRHGRQVSKDPNDDTELSDNGIEEVQWLIEQLRPTINRLTVDIVTGVLRRHEQTGNLLAEAFGGGLTTRGMINPRSFIESLPSRSESDVVIVVHSENTIAALREDFAMIHLQLPQPKFKTLLWGEAAVFNCETEKETLVRRD
jgi:phosphohistidine phosphatase SixA